ncbi:hypothetical protein ACH47X_08180 [Promicromonospora kroppenstedtii]|uniref:DUF2637 domain-containing protein n=1 Tax=Promicromonospora kroppenstedtii TaxID=440482 RepID=A0ABW7XH88_9MICO
MSDIAPVPRIWRLSALVALVVWIAAGVFVFMTSVQGRALDEANSGLPLAAAAYTLAPMTVALWARDAVLRGRPGSRLIGLMWALSVLAGGYAAMAALNVGAGVVSVVSAVVAPLLAAGTWHLLLRADAQHDSKETRESERATRQIADWFVAVEARERAVLVDDGSKRAAVRIRRTKRIAAIAEDRVIRHATSDQIEAATSTWRALSDAAQTAAGEAARTERAVQVMNLASEGAQRTPKSPTED